MAIVTNQLELELLCIFSLHNYDVMTFQSKHHSSGNTFMWLSGMWCEHACTCTCACRICIHVVNVVNHVYMFTCKIFDIR